jgi:hypothetical protein
VQITQKIGKETMDTLFGDLPSDLEAGRFPYAYALIDNQTSARIMFDSRLSHIAVEISGKGMRRLHEKSLVVGLCFVVSANCSRIDVSVDIDTDLAPSDFVGAGYNSRMLSSMTVTSPTGVTEYIGSPKSQKRAAIYRYAPPHPRSAYLRVEHRYRHDAARAMCRYVATNGIAMAVAYAGVEFDWQSPIWDMSDIAVMDLPKLEGDCSDPNFGNWLLRQVFPAMRRAERHGRIDNLRSYVEQYLFEDDDQTDEDIT